MTAGSHQEQPGTGAGSLLPTKPTHALFLTGLEHKGSHLKCHSLCQTLRSPDSGKAFISLSETNSLWLVDFGLLAKWGKNV